MYKKMIVYLLITATMIIMPACGKQKAQDNVSIPEVTTAVTEQKETSETEGTPEETKAIIETREVIEYTMPAGESVERSEDEEQEDAQDRTEETQGSVKPTETIPPVVNEKEDCGCEYSAYAKMSPAEQEAYMNTFASPLDFIEWSKKALAEHEAHDTSIQASGGDLDLSDYIK